MSLDAGTRLGPYEILAPLGSGGMGEVYRAKDTRLGREVAVKILPEGLSASAEARERFGREAKAISSLNHPHICTLYDVGEQGDTRYLVMELVEGETLASRLERGPLKIEEALSAAAQTAEALDRAHRKGIVHRDLKPGNLSLTKGGVKILDFGVAKLREDASGPAAAGTPGGVLPTAAPTRTTPLTSGGAVVGTMQYMAPEQLEGKVVDHRADLFSFGAVLYEMVTGRRAFEGSSQASVIAAILDREPRPVTELLPAAPPALDRAIRTCLAKDPDHRWQSAADLARELRWIAEGREAAAPLETGRGAPAKRAGTKRWALPVAVAAAVALAALALGALIGRRSADSEPPVFRQLTFQPGFIHSARLEPDGKTVVYGLAQGGKPVALFSTRTDSTESRPLDLPGADVAGISRDGQMALLLGRHHIGSWIRVGTLAEVSLTGGTPREILENVFDADISPDGRRFAAVTGDANEQRLEYPLGKVLFRTPGWISQPRIAPDGGRVAFVEHPFYGDDRGYVSLAEPDGRAVRIAEDEDDVQGLSWSPSGNEIWFTYSDRGRGGVVATVAPGGATRIRLRAPVALRVLDVSSSGDILITRNLARADLAGRLAGDEHDRNYSVWSNDEMVGIALDGTIFAGDTPDTQIDGEYTPFFRRNDGRPPVRLEGGGLGAGITPDGRWVVAQTLTHDRSRLTLLPTGPGQPRVIDLPGIEPAFSGNSHVSFSADGRRLAFLGFKSGEGYRAWVLDLSGGAPRPVSPEGAGNAQISPDGNLVAVRIGGRGILVCPSDGGEPKPLPGAAPGEIPVAWSSSGREVLVWDLSFPAKVSKIDRESGRREPVREIEPEDPSGILYGSLVMTPDGRYYIYRYRRVLTDLFVIQGLQ